MTQNPKRAIRRGTVYLVGAGPGDPGLITQRGLDLLRRADVLIYDRILARELLRQARSEALLVGLGRRTNGRRAGPREVRRLIEKHASKGHTIVRLKAGDPFLFGRGGEEAEWLAARQIPFEIVPGVTAGLASAAYAGIPLTHRQHASKVIFITGRPRDQQPLGPVPPDGTVVVYMGVRTLPITTAALREQGWSDSTPAAVIEAGTMPRQRVIRGTLATIADLAKSAGLRPPAVAILGRVVDLHPTLSWAERRPLAGLRVIVTRAADQAAPLKQRLHELGTEVLLCPTLRIRPVRSWKTVDAVLRDLAHYDAVVFTSQNTVPLVFARLRELGIDARAFAGLRVAAVGDATAETLQRHGIKADWIAGEFTTAALAARIARELPPGARVLHPGADKRSPHLEAGLRKHGIHVRNADVYVIARPSKRPKLTRADLVTFASAQTVRNLAAMTKLRPPAVCIGPVTAKAARRCGFRVVAVAKPHTLAGLVEAIVQWRSRTAAPS